MNFLTMPASEDFLMNHGLGYPILHRNCFHCAFLDIYFNGKHVTVKLNLLRVGHLHDFNTVTLWRTCFRFPGH